MTRGRRPWVERIARAAAGIALLAVFVHGGSTESESAETGALSESGTLRLAERFYAYGRFRLAETVAAKLDFADSLALAARAANTRGVYREPIGGKLERFRAAEHYASAGLAIDPGHVEARLQLVIALGQQARTMSALDAYISGIVDRAHAVLVTLLQDQPAHPFVQASFAAWNTEVVLAAGPLLARYFFAATEEAALAAIRQAQALAPDDPLIALEAAKLLERLRGSANRIRLLLESAASLPARDALGLLVRDEAVRLLGEHRASLQGIKPGRL